MQENVESNRVVGRFAPTPSGRMHLGNVLTAMLAYLSAKSASGKCLLRIEDLDERCKEEDTRLLLSDLTWLGFRFDGETLYQSKRSAEYKKQLDALATMGLIYPCYCSRGELATTAPHGADGQVLYDGRCRGLKNPPVCKKPCYRIIVPDKTVEVCDGLQGTYRQNLAKECTDFIVRRADGAFAYQLAVVVDDCLGGVTEVVRGFDLLSSAPRQKYLCGLLGFAAPKYYHTPLLLAPDGRRLAKRDEDNGIGALRLKIDSPSKIIGMLAYNVGLCDSYKECSLDELIGNFSWDKIKKDNIILDDCGLL